MRFALRRTAVPVVTAGTLPLAAGCYGGPAFAELEFNSVEAAKISEIVIGQGSGDITVKTSGRADTAIKRVVRYRGGSQPQQTYRVNGTSLLLDTTCGASCSVSYEVDAPAGATVRGDTNSGDITLATTVAGDVRAETGSGDLRLTVPAGSYAVTTEVGSGDRQLSIPNDPTATHRINLHTGSGDIIARTG